MLNHLEGLKRKSRAGDRSERKSQTEGFGKADFRRVFLRYCENRFTVVGLQHFGGSSDIRCMIEFMQMRSFILMCSMQVAGSIVCTCQLSNFCWSHQKAIKRQQI